MSHFIDTLITVARAEVGTSELNGTNCGPRVNEYKAATDLPPSKSWPWCAAFICWCVREAMQKASIHETKTFRRPRTAGAWNFENWSLAQDDTTSTKKPHRGDIRPGDIVIFKFSHIGLAISTPDKNGNVRTIEGNTDGSGAREGGSVLIKIRSTSSIRSLIRFNL